LLFRFRVVDGLDFTPPILTKTLRKARGWGALFYCPRFEVEIFDLKISR